MGEVYKHTVLSSGHNRWTGFGKAMNRLLAHLERTQVRRVNTMGGIEKCPVLMLLEGEGGLDWTLLLGVWVTLRYGTSAFLSSSC